MLSNICTYCAGHPWICENASTSDDIQDPAVVSRLKQFSEMNLLKRLAFQVSNLYRSIQLYILKLFVKRSNR
jgi:hypothetical protein